MTIERREELTEAFMRGMYESETHYWDDMMPEYKAKRQMLYPYLGRLVYYVPQLLLHYAIVDFPSKSRIKFIKAVASNEKEKSDKNNRAKRINRKFANMARNLSFKGGD